MNDGLNAARAIDALRRGWPVTIDNCLTVLAIETTGDPALSEFDPDRTAHILISSGRALTLKLANQREAAAPDAPVIIKRESWIDLPMAVAIADPALDLSHPMKGPFSATNCDASDAATAALILARHAGLLPSFFVQQGGTGAASTSASEIMAYQTADALKIVSRARLPISAAEQAEIVAFRTFDAGSDHIALIIGQPNGTPPLVRLHSECLTGDVLGSLKCDCGPQLDAALSKIAEQGWGILLYMRQEGRGIGLVNKLRAYALQDQGFDTVDANTRLGFAIDARDFALAGKMLALLGQTCIKLLTNNPDKVAALEAVKIEVVERVAHQLPSNPHNAAYLATKRDRTGHRL